jgi:hypothetical protein
VSRMRASVIGLETRQWVRHSSVLARPNELHRCIHCRTDDISGTKLPRYSHISCTFCTLQDDPIPSTQYETFKTSTALAWRGIPLRMSRALVRMGPRQLRMSGPRWPGRRAARVVGEDSSDPASPQQIFHWFRFQKHFLLWTLGFVATSDCSTTTVGLWNWINLATHN